MTYFKILKAVVFDSLKKNMKKNFKKVSQKSLPLQGS